MNCKFKYREAFIEKYLAKKLTESEQILFEEHFFSCEECFSELETTKQLMEMVKEEGEVLFPEYVKKPIHEKGTKLKISDLINKAFPPKWYFRPSPGYAFIAAAIIIVVIYFLNPSVDSKNDIPMAELYAANYIVSENLEYLIDQGYRDNNFVKVLSPQNGITVQDEVLFNLVSETEQKLYLKILNNEEDLLHKFTLDKNRLLFNIIENKIDPGLYYWKLENDEELLQLGNFFVKEKKTGIN